MAPWRKARETASSRGGPTRMVRAMPSPSAVPHGAVVAARYGVSVSVQGAGSS